MAELLSDRTQPAMKPVVFHLLKLFLLTMHMKNVVHSDRTTAR